MTPSRQRLLTVAGLVSLLPQSGAAAALAGARLNGPRVRLCGAVLTALIAIGFPARALGQSLLLYAGGSNDSTRPALGGALFSPRAVSADRGGNVFVVDGNRIVRIDAITGAMKTIAGKTDSRFDDRAPSNFDGMAATAARFTSISAMTVDGGGNVYLQDALMTWRIDSVTGKLRLLLEQSFVRQLAVAPDQDVFAVANTAVIQVFDAGSTSAVRTTLLNAFSLGPGVQFLAGTVGPNDELYVAYSSTIATVVAQLDAASRSVHTLFDVTRPNYYTALAADTRGSIYGSVTISYGGAIGGAIEKYDIGTKTRTTVLAGGDGLDDTSFTARATRIGTGGELLYFSESTRVRALDLKAMKTFLVAGGAEDTGNGDGGPAIAALLRSSRLIGVDGDGNLFIEDRERLRRISRSTRTITTVLGGGTVSSASAGELVGRFGTDVRLLQPFDTLARPRMTVDRGGNVYFFSGPAVAGASRTLFKVSATTGRLSAVVEDAVPGGPCTSTCVPYLGELLGCDGNGMVYTYPYDTGVAPIYRVNPAAKTVTAITSADRVCPPPEQDQVGPTAGNVCNPRRLQSDRDGNLYFVDAAGHTLVGPVAGRIRKIAASGLTMSTLPVPLRTSMRLADYGVRANGDIYVLEGHQSSGGIYVTRFERDRFTTPIHVAGMPSSRNFGAGGPAAETNLNNAPRSLAVADDGSVYIADFSLRVFAIPPCVTMGKPSLRQPSERSSSESRSPKLVWDAVPGGFGYDVYVDTSNPPAQIVAADLTTTTYSPANLESLTTYYWKVVAKGDPFCLPFSKTASEVYSFTTTATCAAPGAFDATAAQDGMRLTIRWTAAPRAETYDVYVGTSNPPRLVAREVRATTVSISNVAAATSYWWRVVARAACDRFQVSETPVRSIATGGSCVLPGQVMLESPANGDGDVIGTPELRWNPASNAAAYDIYLGISSSPGLYMSDVVGTGVAAPRLTPGVEYAWRVVAKAVCDPSRSTSSLVQRFAVSPACTDRAARK